MSFTLEQKDIDRLNELRGSFESERSLILPALWMVHNKQGFISTEAIIYLEELLGINAVDINEVASFYAMMNFDEKGKFNIKLCKTLSCELRGNEALLEHIMKRLGLSEINETTKDKLFTISFTECLGYCNEAPCMMINKKQYTNLTNEKVDEILDGLKG